MSQDDAPRPSFDETQNADPEQAPTPDDNQFEEKQSIFIASMQVTVDENGVHVKYRPVAGHIYRDFKYDDIISAEKVTYSGLADYGGWGIRENRTSKALTCSGICPMSCLGSEGVMLTLKDTKKSMLIGSHRPDELLKAIKENLSSK